MRHALSAVLLAATLAAAPAWADQYEFDKSHTNILFHINHLGFSDMIGVFTEFNGSLSFDPQHPEESHLDVTLKPAGIRTSSEALDKELQTDKFFNTARYPDIRFVSTSVKATGPQDGDVTGNVTLLGVTRPVVLHVHLNKVGYRPITNAYAAGFGATATLKRSDFGMGYGLPLVGDEVRLEIQTEATDLDRQNAEKVQH